MAKGKKMSVVAAGVLAMVLGLQSGMVVQANDTDYMEQFRGGVAAVLRPGVVHAAVPMSASDELLVETEEQKEESQTGRLVMANVKNSLNVRADASETAEKVGMLYKDCGGTILERRDGWTKLQSGNIIGWASDEYLLFGQEAQDLANSVGKMVATINTEALRVRTEPSTEATVYGMFPKGEIVEVLEQKEDGWICVDFEGSDGYVSADYVVLDFMIDAGETMDEIRAREKEEEEARKEAERHVKYGEYSTDMDTVKLLAALIHCEACGESYEGQVAVGAVVMNRVRSSAYPNTILGVIYASGQFTPAMTGKLDQVYESGSIYESCYRAAEEALSGVSNVGDLTHFRRNNGREGLVIGNHVFY